MTNVASREVRYVNFSWMYHAQMRDIVLAIDAEQDPNAGHDYSPRVAHVVLLAAFIMEATANEVAVLAFYARGSAANCYPPRLRQQADP